jgi:hypothetical protein
MKSGELQLYNLIRKRVMTTMIGAVASLEKYADLFTEEQFEVIRAEIMDKGNDQIRKLKDDISGFQVDVIKTYFMPLRRNREDGK